MDKIMTTSSLITLPKSPWIASAECKNKLGVPVEDKVADNFWPIIPALPMPVTTTLPLERKINCVAFWKLWLICFFKSRIALASISRTCFARFNRLIRPPLSF